VQVWFPIGYFHRDLSHSMKTWAIAIVRMIKSLLDDFLVIICSNKMFTFGYLEKVLYLGKPQDHWAGHPPSSTFPRDIKGD
jgi:hypothetical protein